MVRRTERQSSGELECPHRPLYIQQGSSDFSKDNPENQVWKSSCKYDSLTEKKNHCERKTEI